MSATLLAPPRGRGVEILDDPAVSDDIRAQSLRDVAVSNRLLGGRHAAARAVSALLAALSPRGPVTLLDVGTGAADLPRWLAARHPQLRCMGIDASPSLAREASSYFPAVAGNVVALPFRDRSVDIVLCSQLLHHFEEPALTAVIAELDRVARHGVAIADLRRSHAAAAGFWIVSRVLRFHPVTRHDGVVSVYRGFTPAELAEVVRRGTGTHPRVRRQPGFRLTATWTPGARDAA